MMLTNYYHKSDSKKWLQAVIREITPHNAYKLLSENLFQTMLRNYCKMNHSKYNAYKLFSEKPFQTMLTNYYMGNHSKQCVQNAIREIIPNNTYKLLPDNSF